MATHLVTGCAGFIGWKVSKVLLAEGYMEEDPSRGIPLPKVGKRLPKALTIPQVQILSATMSARTATGRRDQMFFRLVYACGLRIGEAVRLKVENINWEEGWLKVVGKGNKERRVYLKPYLVADLRAYVEENGLEGYLFPGGAGHITVRNMGRQLKKYAEKAELPRHITPHALRHSIAVHYLIGGAPISFVQGLLGHESLETTGVYTRLVDHMAKEITVNTRTAVDGIEGESLREGRVFYAPEFEAWDAYVTEVLEWLGRL